MNIRLLLVSLLCSLSLSMMAISPSEKQVKELQKSHRIITFGDGLEADSVTKLDMINQFYYDQFRNFQDPQAPYFMLMSKDAQLAMGMGGLVRMRGWYDWGGALNNSGFATYDISIPTNPARDRWLGSTPSGTAFFVRVIGHDKKYGNYQLYIEANFNGYSSRDFHLKKAYVQYNDWTLGYANSSFSDPSAQPPTVDAQGPNSEISDTNVLLRWMHTFKTNWVVAASIESPDAQVDADGTTTSTRSNYLPNFAAFGQYEWGAGQHIRLSGIIRGLPYRDLVNGTNHTVVGWGAHVSSIFRVVDPLTVYASFNAGKGYQSLTNDLQMTPLDLIDDPDTKGKMYAPFSLGWYGALQYHFRPNLFSTIMFSEMRFLPKQEMADMTYKYGLYATANVFWNPTPRVQFGAEVNLGKRQNNDGQHRWARRACLMAQFSF